MPSPSTTPRIRRAARRRPLLVAVALLVLAGACSGSGSDSASEPADGATSQTDAGNTDTGNTETTVDQRVLDADVVVRAQDISFAQDHFTASSGTVDIAYVNDGNILHTLVIEDVADWNTLAVARQGDVASADADLAPGEYTLFCNVPGHRSAGMEARLVVEDPTA